MRNIGTIAFCGILLTSACQSQKEEINTRIRTFETPEQAEAILEEQPGSDDFTQTVDIFPVALEGSEWAPEGETYQEYMARDKSGIEASSTMFYSEPQEQEMPENQVAMDPNELQCHWMRNVAPYDWVQWPSITTQQECESAGMFCQSGGACYSWRLTGDMENTGSNAPAEDDYVEPTSACEAYYSSVDLPLNSINIDTQIIRNNVYKDFSTGAKLEDIVFQADTRISKLRLALMNPNANYCVSLEAGNKIKNVKIRAHCDANVVLLNVEAGKVVKGIKVNTCSKKYKAKKKRANWNGFSEPTAPSIGEVLEEEGVDPCDSSLSNFEGYPVKKLNIGSGKKLAKFKYNDQSQDHGVTQINLMAGKKVKKVNLKLFNPNATYCVNLAAGKKIKKVKIDVHCQADLHTVDFAAGKKVKKTRLRTCAKK